MRLPGKTALITGGNSGIGEATARLFAEEGASVALAARDADKTARVAAEIEAGGGRALPVRCDVRLVSDCETAITETVAELGGLDILFNNAGVIFREKSAPETSVEEWDETMAINARGTFLMSKYAVPYLAASRGVIINNASYFGLVGGRGTAAYSASKGAVVALTKAMALDHAAAGIRVNCICPGSVDTPMLRQEIEEMGGEANVRSQFESKHPIGRISTPDEVARAVLFLASDDASFITGAAIPVDGGITAQ
ncbi:MAG: SDR family NAD(P)-dependent oxidoreductase [Acidimicrobiia bacterium]